ncbi:MAG: DUF1971 domain-containing protein [Rickettsiales bacterium]
MKELPEGVVAYKRTPLFTEKIVPAALLANHNTKAGVWGLIHIESGKLEYTIEDKETNILTKDNYGVVEPEVIHHVRPLGEVSFFVEFYK